MGCAYVFSFLLLAPKTVMLYDITKTVANYIAPKIGAMKYVKFR
ncbi:MAG: hypothetical protein Rpha_1043 [Candidatus Ruthia sp. Apha_13_S6]|nr:hypothetical protein [Candidatus Ruthia sp. Apha_13_S6]